MSSRARVRGTVAIVAVLAAAMAVGVAWVGRGEDGGSAQAAGGLRPGLPPLVLQVLVADQGEEKALTAAADLYQRGQQASAASAFDAVLAGDPGSVAAAVGAAFSRWPDETMARLAELEQAHPRDALVKLHVGLALYWQGRAAAAQEAWRQALAVEPDSAAALRAESLLHPELAPGRPSFVPSASAPAGIGDLPALEQLAELERRAQQAGGEAGWLVYGAALQRAGRAVSARKAFERAAALAPGDPEALTAAAVGRFTKDDPSLAVSGLEALAKRYPYAPVVRFHLGLSLLWLKEVERARAELEAAISSGRGTIWAGQAKLLLDKLGGAG